MRILFILLTVIFTFSVIQGQNEQLLPKNLQTLQEEANLTKEIVDLNNSAVEKFLAENYEEAAVEFRQIVSKAPLPQVYYNLGMSLLNLKRSDEAIEIFNKLLEIKPDYLFANVGLGDAFYQKGMFEESALNFRKAIDGGFSDGNAFANYGNSLYKLGKLKEAIQMYDKALKLTSDSGIVYNNRGVVYVVTGKIDEAIADFQKAITFDPKLAQAYSNLAVCMQRKGKEKEAHKYFLEAVRVQPDWGLGIYNLALSYMRINQRESARKQLDLLSGYDSALAEKGRQILWQKYVVNANSFQPR